MDVSARGHDPRAGLERRDNARDRPVGGSRRHRDDRLPAWRERGATHEVHLAADARIDAEADRVRADLARQVEFERRVDRHDLWVLPDERRVVRAIARMELNGRVVVHELEQASRSGDETGDGPSPMDVLQFVRHHAGLDQIDDTVREHLRVDAELVLAEQAPQRGVRNRADPHLQRRAIGDQGRHLFADGVLDRRRRDRLEHVQRAVRMDERVKAIEGDERVAEGARHLLVDLRDQMASRVRGRKRRVDRGAERAVAVPVRRRQLDDRHIEREPSRREQRGNVGEKHRDEIRSSFVDRPAERRADEQGDREEAFPVFRSGKWRRPLSVHVKQLHIGEVRAPRQRLEERRRCGGRAVDEDAHAAPHTGERFVWRHRAIRPRIWHGSAPYSTLRIWLGERPS